MSLRVMLALGGGALALVLLIAGVGAWNKGQAAIACSASIEAKPGQRDLSRCSRKVRDAVLQAEADADTASRFNACSTGLKVVDAKARRWVVPRQCPQSVQNLEADQAARAAEVRSRDGELATLKARQTQAINRAAARAAANARREADADRAYQRAPDVGDGRRRLDADGLCQLTAC